MAGGKITIGLHFLLSAGNRIWMTPAERCDWETAFSYTVDTLDRENRVVDHMQPVSMEMNPNHGLLVFDFSLILTGSLCIHLQIRILTQKVLPHNYFFSREW